MPVDVDAARREWRKRTRNPFGLAHRRPLIVHAGHHRAGTVWFARVLEDLAAHFGFRTQRLPVSAPIRRGVDLLVYEQGGRDFDPDTLPTPRFRATHLVRDPRDMIVSGYRYHLWTEEPWVVRPWDLYGGRSLQEVLRSLPEDEGLAEEIRRCSRWSFPRLIGSKWERPEILLVRYEDLIADEDREFRQIYRHYGFTDAATDVAVVRARAFTFSAVTGRALGEAKEGDHLRSGRPGAWQESLTSEHVRLFDDLNPGLLSQLGYV